MFVMLFLKQHLNSVRVYFTLRIHSFHGVNPCAVIHGTVNLCTIIKTHELCAIIHVKLIFASSPSFTVRYESFRNHGAERRLNIFISMPKFMLMNKFMFMFMFMFMYMHMYILYMSRFMLLFMLTV